MATRKLCGVDGVEGYAWAFFYSKRIVTQGPQGMAQTFCVGCFYMNTGRRKQKTVVTVL